MNAVELHNVGKIWGDTVAVEGLNFSVPAGTFTVLLGPSGCGKSTTLRLIAGLESVSHGKVSINDQDVTELDAAQRNVAMVFQSYALFPHMSVAENIVFGLRVRKVPAAEREARLHKTAQLLGLGDLLNRKPSEISGGQQQRVALGRAVIAERPICLMDEPLSNLDAKLRHEMRIELRALQQKLGMTMVYVTHDQSEAISMADHIVLINAGRIEQIATPEGIYQKPATTFAARFIGTPPMNLIDLEATDGGLCLAGTPIKVATGAFEQPLVLGIRPEEIQVAGGAGHAATVVTAEYLGADTLIDCQLGGQAVTVRANQAAPRTPGETINISWPQHAMHLFDKSSGHRRDDIELRIEGE